MLMGEIETRKEALLVYYISREVWDSTSISSWSVLPRTVLFGATLEAIGGQRVARTSGDKTRIQSDIQPRLRSTILSHAIGNHISVGSSESQDRDRSGPSSHVEEQSNGACLRNTRAQGQTDGI